MTTKHTNLPTYSLTVFSSIYLILAHTKHPTSQTNHPNKAILSAITTLLQPHISPHTYQKVCTHANMKDNDVADIHTISGKLKDYKYTHPNPPFNYTKTKTIHPLQNEHRTKALYDSYNHTLASKK